MSQDTEALRETLGLPRDLPVENLALWFLKNLTHYRNGCSWEDHDATKVRKLIAAALSTAPAPERRELPRADATAIAGGWTLPVDFLTTVRKEQFERTGYGLDTPLETIEAIMLITEAALRTTTAPAPERRSKAIEDVLAERERQIRAENWTPEHDDEHSRGEMAQAAVTYIAHNYRKPYRDPEPVKYQAVAEAALAAHESMGTFRTALKQRAEKRRQEDPESARPSWWPWSIAWWKPTSPRRDLVKAGALILAEIERLDRAEGERA